MKLRHIAVFGGIAAAIAGLDSVPLSAAPPGKETKPPLSEEVNAALLRMGQTLRVAEGFSFQAKTIRVYTDAGGEPLHVFHTMKVTVRRPNKLLVDLTGDDGSDKPGGRARATS